MGARPCLVSQVSFLLGVDLASLGWSGKRSTDRLPQAPVKVETSSLQTLLALGASEEDAKVSNLLQRRP